MIRVFVVDDQKTIHQVVKSYLEIEPDLEIVGFAFNAQVAIKQIESLKPDVVLMDIDMPGMDGLTATKVISERLVTTKVLILTIHDDEQHLNRALHFGAKGYLLKTTPAEELVNAIRYVQKGYFQLGPGLIEKYLSKIFRLEPSYGEISQLKKRLELQAQSLENLSEKFGDFQSESEKKLSQELGIKLRREERILAALETKLQFKLESIGNRVDRLSRNISWLYKLLILTVLIGAIFLTVTSFLVGKWHFWEVLKSRFYDFALALRLGCSGGCCWQ